MLSLKRERKLNVLNVNTPGKLSRKDISVVQDVKDTLGVSNEI